MRWIPLQKADGRAWKLCVLFDDCMTYDVTSIESKHVAEIIHYAAYMNDNVSDGIDDGILEKLNELKREYESN